jgi:hypothetical protein
MKQDTNPAWRQRSLSRKRRGESFRSRNRCLNRDLESANPLVFTGLTGLDVIAHTVTESLAHIERSSVSKRAKPIVSSERLRQSGNLEPPQKSPKSKSEQVPPRHWIGTYLTYGLTTRGIASSRKKGVCVNYPHSLNVRSGIPGSNVLAPEGRRAISLHV